MRFASLGLIAAVLTHPMAAQAAGAGGGGGLPWDAPLQRISQDLTGPWAFAISLIGLAIAGATWILRRDELSEFGRGIIGIVLVAAVLLGANTFFASVGIAGAVV